MTRAEGRSAMRGRAGWIVARGSLGALLLVSLGSAAAQQAPPPSSSLFSQHAQQAGVKACASVYPALGAMVTGASAYVVASSWNTGAPDAHPVQGLVGVMIDAPQYRGPAAGVVLAAPTADGCAGGAVRIVPFPQSCAEVAKQLPAGSRLVRDLSGTPLYDIGGDQGQVMLLDGQKSCIAISVNRIG